MDKLTRIGLCTLLAGTILTSSGCKEVSQQNRDYVWTDHQGQMHRERIVHDVNLPSWYMDWNADSKKQKYKK